MRRKQTKFIIAAGTLAIGAHGPAWAQQATANTAITAQTPPTADASAPGIADIVVTAQKRSENLQKTPLAVTALTGVTLVQKGIANLMAVQEAVPGARFQMESNSVQVFLRGVGTSFDFANSQPAVAFNFNGIFIPSEGTGVGLYDIDKLEVLPGPQGTLYGRSAIGGTINIGFAKPEFKTGFSATLEAGNYARVHPTAIANVALSDSFAVRGVVDYTYHDGYMTSGSDSQNDVSARLSTLWKPNADVSLYWWGYTAQKYGSSPNLVNKGSKPVYDANGNLAGFQYDENAYLTPDPYDDQRPGQLASTAPFGQPTRARQSYNNWATGAQLDVKLGDHSTLTYIPGFFFLDSNIKLFWLGTLPAAKQDVYHQITQELRLSGDTGRLTYLGGLYGYHTIQSGYGYNGTVDGPNGPPIPGTPFPFFGSLIQRNRLEGAAVFGQLTYHFTDRLRLTAGGRYGIDSSKAHGISADDQVTPFTFSHTFYHADYKAAAQYDLTPRIMAYLQFQTGYLPGTFNSVTNLPDRSNLVQTATMKSVAAGLKTRLLNNTLQINDEVFYSDYRNYQIQNYNEQLFYNAIFNAKKVTIPGNQLDILWQPTRDDRINFSVSYIKDRNKNFVTPDGVSYNGLAGPYAADWTINGGIGHDFQMQSGYIHAAADVHYESKFWADFAHNPGTRQDAYAKLNANVTYYTADNRMSFGLWGRNLTNKVTIAATAEAGIPGPATAYLDAPRTYGVRAGVKF